ncbi:MAG TPA: hypothetical protein VI685_26095 [Candidatus Angelobacter sp.]
MPIATTRKPATGAYDDAMFAIAIAYLGLISAFIGALSLIKPLSFLGIPTRQRGLIFVGIGIVVTVIGCLLPARETRIDPIRTQLDQFVPVYQFSEVHSIRITADKEHVYRAIKSVTPDEILFLRTLVWIRRFGRPGPESILNPPKDMPMLDVATRTSFIMLADIPNQEIVVGTLVGAPPGWKPKGPTRHTPADFKALHEPGFALAAMNFRIEEDGPGACIVNTETRVYATDASARRRFAAYWRVIYPGSALIRRMWLRAIRLRATAQVSQQ